jgi:hypothetical protein
MPNLLPFIIDRIGNGCKGSRQLSREPSSTQSHADDVTGWKTGFMTPHEVNTGSAHQTLLIKYLDHGG